MELFTREIELKDAGGVDGEITAYLATFENVDKGGDVIKTGALDGFVAEFDPSVKKLPMFYEHDKKQIIGEWDALAIDEHGLKGRGTIYTETSNGSDVYKLLKRGALTSVSIGYFVKDYGFSTDGVRELKEIVLGETSVVFNPMNPEAKIISVKTDEGFIERKALKTLLKEGGLTNSEIEAFYAHGWKGLNSLREQESDEEIILQALKSFSF